MNARETFAAWAPPESPWSAWAKPVLFTELERHRAGYPGGLPPLSRDEVPWLSAFDRRTALVLDLPREAAVIRGLQVTAWGYRPVPLFNTSWSPSAVVPVQEIVAGLQLGGGILSQRLLPPDAPPAFLLDSGRLPHRSPVAPGAYDNRWVVLPQDFPSGRLLREHGIDVVLLWQRENVQSHEDLAHVLRRWQEAGLQLYRKHGAPSLAPEPLNVYRPSRYRSLFHRFFVLLGLRRNSAGGFGALVPVPSQSRGYG